MSIDLDPTQTPARELRAAARAHPERLFVTIAGRRLTYGDVWQTAQDVAHGLHALGLAPGERVVIIAPNLPETLQAWFAVQLAGAVDAPVSEEAAGAYLDYVVNDLEATTLVGTPETLAKISTATDRSFALRVVIGDVSAVAPIAGTETIGFSEVLERGRAAAASIELPDAWQLGTVMYSSGTTGPSKGVMLSQGYYSTLARAHIAFADLQPGSRFYCVQPLCHIDARSAVIDALHLRGEIVLGSRFSASRFWSEVEKHDADVFFFVGTMIHLLFKQPAVEVVPRARRRIGFGSATPASVHLDFERRFGVELIEGYGMTEFGLMAGQHAGRREPGTIGQELSWVEARLVDELDRDVVDGEVGELLTRPLGQHLHMMGYWRKPEATVAAWRGLWFHTGDLLRRLPSGSLEYVGRNKDSIRRRGENVSAWEVEEAAARHPGVLQAAAIGVPSDVGDEDVALLVVASSRGLPDLAELRDAMASDLPRYALPRFIEVVDALPKTPSERVAKAAVRARGITKAALDFDERRGGPPDQVRSGA